MPPCAICSVCGGGPMAVNCLSRHLRSAQQWTESQIEAERRSIREKRLYDPGNYPCPSRNRLFHSDYSRRTHFTKAHGSPVKRFTGAHLVCPSCQKKCTDSSDLIVHWQKEHDLMEPSLEILLSTLSRTIKLQRVDPAQLIYSVNDPMSMGLTEEQQDDEEAEQTGIEVDVQVKEEQSSPLEQPSEGGNSSSNPLHGAARLDGETPMRREESSRGSEHQDEQEDKETRRERLKIKAQQQRARRWENSKILRAYRQAKEREKLREAQQRSGEEGPPSGDVLSIIKAIVSSSEGCSSMDSQRPMTYAIVGIESPQERTRFLNLAVANGFNDVTFADDYISKATSDAGNSTEPSDRSMFGCSPGLDSSLYGSTDDSMRELCDMPGSSSQPQLGTSATLPDDGVSALDILMSKFSESSDSRGAQLMDQNEANASERPSSRTERRRRHRRQMDAEGIAAIRAADAERHRLRRARMSEEEAAARRAAHAERQRKHRQQLDETAAKVHRALCAERQRRVRAQMDEARLAARRAADAERHRLLRTKMSEAQRAAMRARHAERQRRARAQMDEARLAARRAADAERQRLARARMRQGKPPRRPGRPRQHLVHASTSEGGQNEGQMSVPGAVNSGGSNLDSKCLVCGLAAPREEQRSSPHDSRHSAVFFASLRAQNIIEAPEAGSMYKKAVNTTRPICPDHYIQAAAYIGEEIEDKWGRYPENGLDEVPCAITVDFLDYLQVYSVQVNRYASLAVDDVAGFFKDCLTKYYGPNGWKGVELPQKLNGNLEDTKLGVAEYGLMEAISSAPSGATGVAPSSSDAIENNADSLTEPKKEMGYSSGITLADLMVSEDTHETSSTVLTFRSAGDREDVVPSREEDQALGWSDEAAEFAASASTFCSTGSLTDLSASLDSLNDEDFRNRFRITRRTFHMLCATLDKVLSSKGMPALGSSMATALGTALDVFAANVPLTMEHSLASSKVMQDFAEVLAVLAEWSSEMVQWPEDKERMEISECFFQMTGLRDIVGCIDGTVVVGTQNLNVGLVADHRKRFRWVFSKCSAKEDDDTVFKRSMLHHQLFTGVRRGRLVGDDAYTSDTFLLTPSGGKPIMTAFPFSEAIVLYQTYWKGLTVVCTSLAQSIPQFGTYVIWQKLLQKPAHVLNDPPPKLRRRGLLTGLSNNVGIRRDHPDIPSEIVIMSILDDIVDELNESFDDLLLDSDPFHAIGCFKIAVEQQDFICEVDLLSDV